MHYLSEGLFGVFKKKTVSINARAEELIIATGKALKRAKSEKS